MTYKPVYSHRAISDLGKLDKAVAERIFDKIDDYCATTNPLRFAKPLTGPLKNSYRFRIGDYRAIFETDRQGHISIIFITHVGHRSEIYE